MPKAVEGLKRNKTHATCCSGTLVVVATMEPQTSLGFHDWHWDEDVRPASSMDFRHKTAKTALGGGLKGFDEDQLAFEGAAYHPDRTRACQVDDDVDLKPSQVQMQRYQQHERSVQRDVYADASFRRAIAYPEHDLYARDTRDHEPGNTLQVSSTRRVPRNVPIQRALSPGSFDMRSNRGMRQSPARLLPTRRFNSPEFGSRMDELPLEPAMLEMYPDDEMNPPPLPEVQMPRRREDGPSQQPVRQRTYQQVPKRGRAVRVDDEMMMADARSFHPSDGRRGGEAVYDDVGSNATMLHTADCESRGGTTVDTMYPSSRPEINSSLRPHMPRRSRVDDVPLFDALNPGIAYPSRAVAAHLAPSTAYTSWDGKDDDTHSKRRCGRKSMNYSFKQKRERNRAAVKKCRQRQALKLEYLQRKAESLAAENQTLSQMLVTNTELGDDQRTSLTRGIQIDILLKIKEIFTQSLPKDFVLDADSIWDLNSVLAVSMPSRCYYGIESIKDFWRTSLRMRNKGKIRSFWGWLFRLPPGDRFSEFHIQPFASSSNLYSISWTTKSTPLLTGSMVIMFGNGHRVTLHVECFGWLIWRYLLTNEPFPETSTA